MEFKKKKILGIPVILMIIGIIGLMGVSAALVSFFGQAETTLDVESPIQLTGDAEVVIEAMGGETVVGEDLTIVNLADFAIDVQLTSDNDEAEVGVTYRGTLDLTQKRVDFGADVWVIDPSGDTAVVEYTLVGDEFSAEVVGGEKEGYVLIYYKDNSDRYNNPAIAILAENVDANLPYDTDGNADEYDYCATGEYDTCHGAKIWYVPESEVDGSGNIYSSMASQFLYETELIQYNDAGVITMWPNSNLPFNPIFDLDLMLQGTVVITTTVDVAE